jgi:hypothetical protein
VKEERTEERQRERVKKESEEYWCERDRAR